jgi:hypothetical protein
MMWIATSVAGTPPKDFSEPPPALCSSQEPVKGAGLPSTPSDAMWVNILEFEFFAELGEEQFRTHEARLKASSYGVIRLSFNGMQLRRRLRSLVLDDFVQTVGEWTDSLAFCRRYYKENGLTAADPLPADAIPPDRQQVDDEMALSGMLSAIFALAARDTVTKEILDLWMISAERAGLSAVRRWLSFVAAIFVDETIKAEGSVNDSSLAWPWQAVASIRVAVDTAVGPVELLTIHYYWAKNLPKTLMGSFVLADIEHLVTSAWRRLCERRFLLRTPTRTVPVLEEACARDCTGWQKIGEVLTAACDAVPATVPSEFQQMFRELK